MEERSLSPEEVYKIINQIRDDFAQKMGELVVENSVLKVENQRITQGYNSLMESYQQVTAQLTEATKPQEVADEGDVPEE